LSVGSYGLDYSSGGFATGDTFVQASVNNNSLQIITLTGDTGNKDIKLKAGRTASDNSDLFIKGTGTTRGYVGFGTENPTERVDVSGKTKTINLQITSGASAGYVLVSDASGNAIWSAATMGSGSSGTSGSSGVSGSSGSSGSSGINGSSGSSGSSGVGFNAIQTPALTRVLTSDGTTTGAIAQSGLTYNGSQLTVSGLTYTSGVTSISGIIFKQVTISSSYTATTDDYMIDITGGTFTVSLPTAVGQKGRLYVIKNNGGGAVTVDPFGGETIDGKPFVILGETNSIQIASNGIEWVALGYNISTVNSSTGVFEFTGLTVASPTTFTVAPVKGWIVDDTSNPLSPQLYYLSYTGGTHTATYVTATTATWIYLTSGGTLAQSSTPLTDQQRRQNLFLGKLGHANKTSIINAFSQPDFVLSPLAQVRDMFEPINLVNAGIRPYANGANLRFNTSAGYLHGLGINFANDTLNPDSLYISGTSPCTFQYRVQTGGTATNTTFIDPTSYDVGGVVTPLSGTKATNQRIYLVQNGVFRVQYGQTFYSTLAQAVAGIATEQYVEFSNFTTNGILIGILSVLSSATDLSDSTKALFFNVSKFGDASGAAGGTPTTNLQQAYDNSAEPEILTNSTLGAVTIKNGSGNPDSTSSLLEGLNSSGGVTSFIRANGSLSASTISATTISATTYQNLPSDVVIINSTQIQSGFTGGVLFQSSASTVSQTTGFTWDNVNKRMGIGVSNPQYDLDVYGAIYQKTGELLITSTGGVNKEGPFIASSGGDEVSSDRKIQIGILDNSTVPVGIDMFVTNNTFPPSYMNFRVNNSDLVRMSGSSVIISGNTFTSGMTATTISATSLSALTVTSPTVSATTVTSRTVSATTLSALTATSTTISATSVSAITFNLSGSQIESSWTSYTPVWTASGTNPVIGNGTIEGYYKLIGKTCFVRGNIAMGSTTTFGSGEWYVSMPFTAKHADAILLTATLLDNSSAWYNATMVGARAGFNNKAPMQYVNYTNGTASDVNATQPFTWTTSDRFIWNGSYEIA